MHKFLAGVNLAEDRIEIRGVDVSQDGHTAAIKPVVYEVADRGAVVEPFLRLEREGAQMLANQLWEAGVRPAPAMQAIAAASQQAGGQTAPWLMRQLEKFIDNVTRKETNHDQRQG